MQPWDTVADTAGAAGCLACPPRLPGRFSALANVPFMIFALVAALNVLPVQATPSPQRLLGLIRAKFRSHRPPPPYVVYTIERKENTSQGYPDYAYSYIDKVWCRSVDRASLQRRVYRSINRGALVFNRPAFNEARDPGPPTADLFEPAPAVPHPVSFVPTPEPAGTPLPIIGTVTTVGEFDYRVESVDTAGDTLHLKILPTRDPDRNRLRELFVDRSTYELKEIVATDKLFIDGTHDVYGVTFDVKLANLQGTPVVTDIHGTVGDGYAGDGTVVDYHFRNIAFPPDLPSWYFDPGQYARHPDDAPI